ncbi:MAG: protein arginine kinase [Verrucomicrobia bacterium]|nr:MAG: protein arginine kinase [Verrucomicrobiota bacterium]
MHISPILESRSDMIESSGQRGAVVLMTRVRFARNIVKHPFPGWAKESQRREILAECLPAVAKLPQMKKGFSLETDTLSDLEKQILHERHLISRELMAVKGGSGIVISRDQSFVVMINEEDHLRIQVLRGGFNFRRVWNTINAIDSSLEEDLDYAYMPKLGYLTACPTNVGTAMRASAMMHLPALVVANQMERVVRAVNQLGIAVRGLFGEGSDASGSIFQISNQTTLGESEEEIIKRLTSVLNTIIEQEINAREKILETEPNRIFDKIGRAYGILQNGHLISSGESMNLLSLVRLGVDFQVFPEEIRPAVDRLIIDCQPGHIQYRAGKSIDSEERDSFRSTLLRSEFEKVAKPSFSIGDAQ